MGYRLILKHALHFVRVEQERWSRWSTFDQFCSTAPPAPPRSTRNRWWWSNCVPPRPRAQPHNPAATRSAVAFGFGPTCRSPAPLTAITGLSTGVMHQHDCGNAGQISRTTMIMMGNRLTNGVDQVLSARTRPWKVCRPPASRPRQPVLGARST
jgi:hypothetical protein